MVEPVDRPERHNCNNFCKNDCFLKWRSAIVDLLQNYRTDINRTFEKQKAAIRIYQDAVDRSYQHFQNAIDRSNQHGMSPERGGGCVLSPGENQAESKHNGGGQSFVTIPRVNDLIINQNAAIVPVGTPQVTPEVAPQVAPQVIPEVTRRLLLMNRLTCKLAKGTMLSKEVETKIQILKL